MRIAARVVTVHPESPGNSASVPAFPREAARTSAVFPGVSSAAATRGTSRVNVGAFNPHAAAVDAVFRLVDREGAGLGEVTLTLGPGASRQVNDVFRELGASGPVAGARLELTSRLPVFPYVVAVDDRSGDATFVPASDLTPRP